MPFRTAQWKYQWQRLLVHPLKVESLNYRLYLNMFLLELSIKMCNFNSTQLTREQESPKTHTARATQLSWFSAVGDGYPSVLSWVRYTPILSWVVPLSCPGWVILPSCPGGTGQDQGQDFGQNQSQEETNCDQRRGTSDLGYPSPCWHTHTCENSTLAILRMRVVMIQIFLIVAEYHITTFVRSTAHPLFILPFHQDRRLLHIMLSVAVSSKALTLKLYLSEKWYWLSRTWTWFHFLRLNCLLLVRSFLDGFRCPEEPCIYQLQNTWTIKNLVTIYLHLLSCHHGGRRRDALNWIRHISSNSPTRPPTNIVIVIFQNTPRLIGIRYIFARIQKRMNLRLRQSSVPQNTFLKRFRCVNRWNFPSDVITRIQLRESAVKRWRLCCWPT